MSALDRYVQPKHLSNFFMRLNISENPVPPNINNDSDNLQEEQIPREAPNHNNTREIDNPQSTLTPRGNQSRPTELRDIRKHYRNRVQPYVLTNQMKARKNLKF